MNLPSLNYFPILQNQNAEYSVDDIAVFMNIDDSLSIILTNKFGGLRLMRFEPEQLEKYV